MEYWVINSPVSPVPTTERWLYVLTTNTTMTLLRHPLAGAEEVSASEAKRHAHLAIQDFAEEVVECPEIAMK